MNCYNTKGPQNKIMHIHLSDLYPILFQLPWFVIYVISYYWDFCEWLPNWPLWGVYRDISASGSRDLLEGITNIFYLSNMHNPFVYHGYLEGVIIFDLYNNWSCYGSFLVHIWHIHQVCYLVLIFWHVGFWKDINHPFYPSISLSAVWLQHKQQVPWNYLFVVKR